MERSTETAAHPPLSFSHTLHLSPFAPHALVTILICLAAGCAAPRSSNPVAVEQRAWTEPGPDGLEFLTTHFDIRTTVRDSLLREVLPVFMETAFSEYSRLMPPTPGDFPRLPIYLFDTREEWARFTRHFAPADAQTYLHIHAGGYTDYRTATSVTFDLGRDHTLSLLAHEGFHQYAARYRTQPLPSWLNEGLACQFETFTLDGQRPIFTPRNNLVRLGSLRDALTPPNSLAALPGLLRMNAGHAVRQTGTPAPTYYAQLWSTVLYLRDRSCPYAAGFHSLLADAGTPALAQAVRDYRAKSRDSGSMSDAEVVFRCYITSDWDGFAARYRAFAERLVH
jgi:hypothetical protein